MRDLIGPITGESTQKSKAAGSSPARASGALTEAAAPSGNSSAATKVRTTGSSRAREVAELLGLRIQRAIRIRLDLSFQTISQQI
ncbi:hypothetical protein GCM10027088_31160 [Nocardia goodfellowii]